MWVRWVFTTSLVVTWACLGFAAEEERLAEELAQQFALAFNGANGSTSSGLWSELDRALNGHDGAAEVARGLLAHKQGIVRDRQVVALLDSLAADNAVLAARLLVQIARGKVIARSYEGSRVVVGQLIVEDKKVDPTRVLTQMPILEQGYFAGEVGSLARPLCFRSHGYEDLDVSLGEEPPDTGDVVFVGQVTLRPLAADQKASLRGTVVLDAAPSPESAGVTVSVAMPPINTPHNGFSGRPSWPEGIRVPVSKSGEFVVGGLNPTEYFVFVSAEEHVDFQKKMTLTAGESTDAGDCRLFSSDLGFYVGTSPPERKELIWEADYSAALRRAEAEKRPLLVMMTATWCGPCKLLEDETLNDPWIRHFLSSFVMVKAYEDKAVEQTYGLNGYPTLVFTDSSGKLVHKCVGYMPAFRFAAECAKAHKALAEKLPPELQKLVDKKIIALE